MLSLSNEAVLVNRECLCWEVWRNNLVQPYWGIVSIVFLDLLPQWQSGVVSSGKEGSLDATLV